MATNPNENVNDTNNAGREGIPISGGAQTLAVDSRYVLVSTAGNIVGRLINDTSDKTYALPVGMWKLAFRSVTSATAAGFFIL